MALFFLCTLIVIIRNRFFYFLTNCYSQFYFLLIRVKYALFPIFTRQFTKPYEWAKLIRQMIWLAYLVFLFGFVSIIAPMRSPNVPIDAFAFCW